MTESSLDDLADETEPGSSLDLPADVAASGSSLDDELLRRDVKARMFGTRTAVAIGGYAISHRIGAGGMGVVYAARDPRLERDVALKLVLAGHRHGQERMLREARALAKLAHPNVVTIHEVGVHDDQLFVAMELVVGTTLRRWLETPRTLAEIADVFGQAAAGLAAAHEADLVHRDFKPDNVLIGDDGRVRVVDFGLARIAGLDDATAAPAEAAAGVAITQTGDAIGTPVYMAYEQLCRGELDARTDIFAFCVALYEALHGHRPYTETTIGALMSAIQNGPGGLRWRGDLPRRLVDLVRRGLAADPNQRPTSLQPFIAELQKLQAPRRRAWLPWTAAALGGAALIIGGQLGSGPSDPPPSDAAVQPAALPSAEDHLCEHNDAPDPRSCDELTEVLMTPAGAEDWDARCAYRRSCAAPDPVCPPHTHWDGTLGCALAECGEATDDDAIAACDRGDATCCPRAATVEYMRMSGDDPAARDRVVDRLAKACGKDDAVSCDALASVARRFSHDEASAVAALVTACRLGSVRSCRRIAILAEEREGLRRECTMSGENCDGVRDAPVQRAYDAACRTAEWEVPAFLDDEGYRLSAALAREGIALTAAEVEAIDQAEAVVRTETLADYREMARMFGIGAGVDRLGIVALGERLREHVHAEVDASLTSRAHQKIADARGGIVPARPIAREYPLDRWYRVQSSIATRMRDVLAESLGADGASALHRGRWPDSTLYRLQGNCPD